MSKYDFGYEISQNSTIEWAYGNIEKCSCVLELGPANGNLVKHLKEDKDCTVDIIEIDEDAGKHALEFARRGCIGNDEGNLENLKWVEILSGAKYDYIVILDVLEHLRNPEEVLARLGGLLKDDGRILLSLPNVAHNSVLIGLLNNRFNYTDVGLLDNTHVKFFTYQTALDIIYSSGYYTEKEEIRHIKVGNNEIDAQYEEVTPDVQAYLKTRKLGEAYQFLLTLKKGIKEKEYKLFEKQYIGKMYAFNVFNELNELIYTVEINPMDKIKVCIPLTDDKSQVIRIDPLDKACILQNIQLTMVGGETEKECEIYQSTGIDIDDKIVFFDDDPQIYVQKEKAYESLLFECDCISFESSALLKISELRDYIRSVRTQCYEQIKQLDDKENIIAQYTIQKQKMESELEESQNEIKVLIRDIDIKNNKENELLSSLNDKQKQIQTKDNEIGVLQNDLDELKMKFEELSCLHQKEEDRQRKLLNKKTEQLEKVSNELNEKTRQLEKASNELNEKEVELTKIKECLWYKLWKKIKEK